ncbi:hypothetical protein H9M94_03450 [Mycoplasma sp. Pen4]|uniref:MAGa3780 family membrane protein n=1 Tax=Mycoplasma sp. Pen4 TaxID=640330 RepID=UPI001654420E|nr:hypothetical protein [Mycoplasma sp. Pen4]QNM93623.1 hypothetical protein H9M94_03450 [Mycoplasma sp. Pen4]
MIENTTKNSLFHDWDRKRKMAFWAGIAILVIIVLCTIWTWIIYNYDELIPALKYTNNSSHFGQPVYARYWAVTYTFTWMSNIFLAFALILYAIWPKNWITQRMLFLATIYITITMLIFWALVFPSVFKGEPAQKIIVSTFVHFVTPIIAYVAFVKNRKEIEISKKVIWYSSIALFIYWLFALVLFLVSIPYLNEVFKDTSKEWLNSPEGKEYYKYIRPYIYPFLDFSRPLFVKTDNNALKVLLNMAIVVIGFFIPPFLGYVWKWSCKLQYAVKNNKKIEITQTQNS